MGFAFWFCRLFFFVFFFLLQGTVAKDLQMARILKSKFVIHISAEGLESFGVDTPVSLVAKERQSAFREVTDQRLKRILLMDDRASIVAVKMVLGKGHLERNEFARDNAHISSRFLAVLLDLDTPKAKAMEMTVRLFRDDLLGGLETTLKAAFIGKGIPRPADLPFLWESDEAVKVFPFLLDLKGPALSRHRKIADVAVDFLKRKLKLVPVEGLEWLDGFIRFAELNGFM